MGTRRHRRPARVLFATVAATALATSATITSAAGPQNQRPAAPPPGDVDSLTTGYWVGVGHASGTAEARPEPGVFLDVLLSIDADFEFVAVSEDGGPGEVAGTWGYYADFFMFMEATQDGVRFEGTADLTGTGGGPMGGTTHLIELTGTDRSVGVVQGSAMGQSVTIPIDNTNPLPPMNVRIIGGTCNEVYGDWVYSLEQAIEAEAFRADFDGHWYAWRDPSRDAPDLSVLRDAVAAGDPDELTFSGSPVFDEAADAIIEANEFFDAFPEWERNAMFDILERLEESLNDLRAFDDCDTEFFGEDDVRRFITTLTRAVQQIVEFGVTPETSVVDWQLLVHAAVRTGAIGAGSVDPVGAAAAEDALRSYAEQVLSDAVAAGQLGPDAPDDVTRTLGTAAMMGWTLDLPDGPSDARVLWIETFGGGQ